MKININNLKKYLNDWGVPENTYSLVNEEHPEDKVTIYNNLQTYEVYYCERGLKIDKTEFIQEEDACKAFLRLLLSSSRVIERSEIKHVEFDADKIIVQYQNGDKLNISEID